MRRTRVPFRLSYDFLYLVIGVGFLLALVLQLWNTSYREITLTLATTIAALATPRKENKDELPAEHSAGSSES